jgi:hypothetical protein
MSWCGQNPPPGLGNAAKGIRGYGTVIANGDYLFVGLSNVQLRRMRTSLDRVFL